MSTSISRWYYVNNETVDGLINNITLRVGSAQSVFNYCKEKQLSLTMLSNAVNSQFPALDRAAITAYFNAAGLNAEDLRGIAEINWTNVEAAMQATIPDMVNIVLNPGAPVVNGSGSNEHFVGNGDDNRIFGSSGNDLLEGNDGDDRLVGGPGNDWLKGGKGNDDLEADQWGAEIPVIYIPGYFAADGNWQQSRLRSIIDNEINILDGGDGNDGIQGGYGSDHLIGGAGNDFIDSSPFSVQFNPTRESLANIGPDLIEAGSGNDTITMTTLDQADGGSGDDIFNLGFALDDFETEGYCKIIAGEGADTIRVHGGSREHRPEIHLEELIPAHDTVNDGLIFTMPNWSRISGFDFANDTLNLSLYRTVDSDLYYYAANDGGARFNYSFTETDESQWEQLDVRTSRVQFLDSPTSQLQKNKGLFVIRGAPDVEDNAKAVAALINSYEGFSQKNVTSQTYDSLYYVLVDTANGMALAKVNTAQNSTAGIQENDVESLITLIGHKTELVSEQMLLTAFT